VGAPVSGIPGKFCGGGADRWDMKPASDMDDERIERLLREGRISHEEAERLRAAWLRSPAANVPLPPSPWHSPARIALLVAAMALLGTVAFEAGHFFAPRRQNLVRNGGFESGDVVPSGWSALAPSGDSRFEAVAGAAPAGRRFGRIERAGGASSLVDSWTQDLGPAPSSRRIDVSLWVAARGAGSAAVTLQFDARGRSPSTVVVFDLPADAEWTRLERELPVPDEADSMTLAVQLRGPGRLDLDDVCVEPIPAFRFAAGEELIADGSFENGGAASAPWRHPSSPDGIVYAIETSPRGGRSAVVRSAIDGAGLAFVGWSQRLDRFPTEVELDLAAEMRASASGLANVEVVALDAAGAAIASTALVSPADSVRTVEWRRWTARVRAPGGARSLEIRCVVRGVGTAEFRSISLRTPSSR
jgi:hypothetical protein